MFLRRVRVHRLNFESPLHIPQAIRQPANVTYFILAVTDCYQKVIDKQTTKKRLEIVRERQQTS